jgi:aminopeptidase N
VVPDRSAMETQTMVTLGDLSGYRGETVLLHELTHQWFGDTITPTTWRDLWLNEGCAMYTEMLYSVEFLGDDQRETIESWWHEDGGRRSVAGPPGAFDPAYFADRNVYIGTGLMLHAFRMKLGDQRFFVLLRDWVQLRRNSSVDREEFNRWLARNDPGLQEIATLWLFSPTTPLL